VIFATFCADSSSVAIYGSSFAVRRRRGPSQKVAKVSKKGSGKAGFYYPRDSSRYLQGQAGGVQDICRDPVSRIDRLQLFEIFVAFCADSLHGFTRSADDRDGRILSADLKGLKDGILKGLFFMTRVIRRDICELTLIDAVKPDHEAEQNSATGPHLFSPLTTDAYNGQLPVTTDSVSSDKLGEGFCDRCVSWELSFEPTSVDPEARNHPGTDDFFILPEFQKQVILSKNA